MARLSATRRSCRASVTTSGSRVATTCWQNECDSGVSRQVAHGSGSPTAPGNHCRSVSTRLTSATGTPRACCTKRA